MKFKGNNRMVEYFHETIAALASLHATRVAAPLLFPPFGCFSSEASSSTRAQVVVCDRLITNLHGKRGNDTAETNQHN